MSDLQQIVQYVLAAAVFMLVLSLWVGAVLIWSYRRANKIGAVERRLVMGSGSNAAASDSSSRKRGTRALHLWHDGRDYTTIVPKGGRLNWVRRQEQILRQAGYTLTAWQTVALLIGASMITIVFVMMLTANVLLAVGITVGLLVLARIYILLRVERRQAHFERQLVDALELTARSLRAGHPLLGAFQLVSEELDPPVSAVFAEICQRHGMGAELPDVLRRAGEQSANEDMKLFATSVAIQVRTGGNLADLMERLAMVIRDRIRVHRRARVLTAQTQMSKRVLIALPIALFFVLNVVNPTYMEPFYTNTAAQMMLGIGVLMLVLGTWLMNRMAVIRY